jgi:hypothetical protein
MTLPEVFVTFTLNSDFRIAQIGEFRASGTDPTEPAGQTHQIMLIYIARFAEMAPPKVSALMAGHPSIPTAL